MGYKDRRFARRCLDFDGSNDYVDFGDVYGFERTDTFSLSVWFKNTASSGNEVLLSKMASSAPFNGYALQMRGDTNKIRAYLINNFSGGNYIQVETTNAYYGDGTWHHLVMTYDGSSTAAGVKIYVDGQLETPANVVDTLSASILTAANVNVATRNGAAADCFTGRACQVSVWDDVLTAAEVWSVYRMGNPGDLSLLTTTAVLQSWWRLGDDTIYPVVPDSAGSVRGYMKNMASDDVVDDDAPYGQSPQSTKSLVFDGVNETVTMGVVYGFERTDTFSFSFWIKAPVAGAYRILARMQAGAPEGYAILVNSTGKIYLYLVNTWATNCISVYADTVGAINDGAWHHVAVCYDGSSLASGVTIYYDNSSMSLTTQYDNLTATIIKATDFKLGGWSTGTQYLAGSLDEVSVWDKELSSGDVSEVYNSGWGDVLTGVSCHANLVGWWRCGDYASSPTIPDESAPSGNDGTMSNMESTDIQGDTPYGLTRLTERSVIFDGGEYVNLGNVLGFERNQTRSIQAWVWTSGTGNYAFAGKMNGTPFTGWSVHVWNTAVYFVLINTWSSNAMEVYAPGAAPLSNWNHILVTYDGTSTAAGVKIYVNGSLKTNTVTYDSLSATILNAADMYLGARSATGSTLNLNGQMCEFAMWDKVLSAAEVAEAYGDKEPVNLMDLSTAGNLLCWHRMGEGDVYPTLREAVGGFDGTMTSMETTDLQWGAPQSSFDGHLFDVSGDQVADTYDRFRDGHLFDVSDAHVSETYDRYRNGHLFGVSGQQAYEVPDPVKAASVIVLVDPVVPVAPVRHYVMRGWNTVLLDWEVWQSVDEPDLTPPIGPCVNISIESFWD